MTASPARGSLDSNGATAPFDYGLITGVLLMLSANAAHWLLTTHPGVSTARIGAVVVQLLIGVVGSLWLVRARRRGPVRPPPR